MISRHKMLNLYRIGVLLLVVILGGCAALPLTIPINSNDISALKNSTVTITHQQTQGFLFNTPSTALVDAGVAEWVDSDKAITWGRVLQGNQVPDFTESVAKEFKKQVEGNFILIDSGQVEPFDQSADFSRLTSKYDTDYTLEVRTQFGSFSYGPLSWRTYNLNYSADVVVIRSRDQKPIWKMLCSVGPEEGNPLKVPGNDFLSGNGEKLRTAAEYATSYCGKKLAQEFLITLEK